MGAYEILFSKLDSKKAGSTQVDFDMKPFDFFQVRSCGMSLLRGETHAIEMMELFAMVRLCHIGVKLTRGGGYV